MTTAAASVEVSPATMKVATTAKGEANHGTVSVIVGIGLIVWRVVAVAAQSSTAMPVPAMSPTTTTAAIVYLCDVRSVLHLQASQAGGGSRCSWTGKQSSAKQKRG